MHRFLNIFLSMSLLVSMASGSFGAALGAGGQMMVICAGEGERIAMIGVDGTEIPMLHDCGECCISTLMLVPDHDAFGPPTTVIVAQFIPYIITLSPVLPELFAHARGPPEFG